MVTIFIIHILACSVPWWLNTAWSTFYMWLNEIEDVLEILQNFDVFPFYALPEKRIIYLIHSHCFIMNNCFRILSLCSLLPCLPIVAYEGFPLKASFIQRDLRRIFGLLRQCNKLSDNFQRRSCTLYC